MKKIRYIFVGLKLFYFVKNWWDLPLIILGFKNKVELKNGLTLFVSDYLNLLQIIEIIYGEEYIVDIKNPRVIIDVGANIGDSTIYFAKKFPKAKIYAFEPNKKVFKIFLKNLKLNNIRNVVPINLGLSQKGGVKKFYSYEFSGLSGFKKIDRKAKTTKISTISLERFLTREKIKSVDLFKLDCEGAEYEVLLNLKPLIYKKIFNIVVEYHEGLTKYTRKDLEKKLKERGFRLKMKRHNIETNIGIIYAKK